MRLRPLPLLLLILLPLHARAEEKSFAFKCEIPILWGTGDCGKNFYEVPAGGSIKIKVDGPAFNKGALCLDFELKNKAEETVKELEVCQGESHTVSTSAKQEVRLEASSKGIDKGWSKATVTGTVIVSSQSAP